MSERRRFVLALACVLVVGACSGSDGEPEGSTSEVPRITNSSTAPRESDSVLRIGVLVPPEQLLTIEQRDDLRSALEAGVRIINRAGTPWIEPVEIVFSDESTSISDARTTVDALLDDDIDALIGPVSSDIAATVVRDVTTRDVGICSPGSTSALMAKVPDDGLLIRTTPTDEDIAIAMTREIEGRGYNTAAVFFPETTYGRAVSEIIAEEMIESGLNLTRDGEFNRDLFISYQLQANGITRAIAQIDDLAPTIVLLIGDETIAPELIDAFPAKDLITSDGLTGAAYSEVEVATFSRSRASFDGFAIDAFDGVDQTISSLRLLDPDLQLLTDGRIPLLAAFVDCLNVLSLSSVLADSDMAQEFMSQTVAATTSGSTCRTFVECIELVNRSLNFDYDGWGSGLSLDESGGVVDGPLLVYGLDPSGIMVFREYPGS